MVLSLDASESFAAIADAMEFEDLMMEYNKVVDAIVNQHTWNLLWIGIVTFIGELFIWRAHIIAIWVTALVGELADINYFIFLDLPGYVNFLPVQ